MRNLISNGLKRLVRNEPRYARGDRHAHIISIATVKGGVGKTTSAVNIASALAARHDRKVLLVDLVRCPPLATRAHADQSDSSG